ncbi:MAG: acyl-CoA dehydrogenase family protein, partial [Bryobacteraceae bacterium]|nr:acyl-CoA dehydrogenase family protein [Bryobacteraceae bacterium]
MDWAGLVASIQAGEAEGMERLYRLFSRGIRYYLCRQLGPQELDDKEEFSYELTRKMGELDFFGPFVSEEYGGSDVGYLNYIIIVEEIARIDGSQAATIAAGNSLGIAPIYYFGTEEQKGKLPAEKGRQQSNRSRRGQKQTGAPETTESALEAGALPW